MDTQYGISGNEIADAVHGFIECALWAGLDDNDTPLDANWDRGDIAPEVIAEIETEVSAFLETCVEEEVDLSGWSPEQFGHDFYLTRNRHGAGFWDRGRGDVGEWLTSMAHPYGQFDLYVGDDSQLWV